MDTMELPVIAAISAFAAGLLFRFSKTVALVVSIPFWLWVAYGAVSGLTNEIKRLLWVRELDSVSTLRRLRRS
jgi:hypothetical protein